MLISLLDLARKLNIVHVLFDERHWETTQVFTNPEQITFLVLLPSELLCELRMFVHSASVNLKEQKLDTQESSQTTPTAAIAPPITIEEQVHETPAAQTTDADTTANAVDDAPVINGQPANNEGWTRCSIL